MINNNYLSVNKITLEQFQEYILFDKKLSANRPAMSALTQRFKYLKTKFSDIELNRTNFTRFLAEEERRGIAKSTLNKLIGVAKHVAKMLDIHDLDDFSYFREIKKDVDVLSWDEMKSLAEVVVAYRLSKGGLTSEQQNNRMWCYITLLSEVGCRRGEALNLLWKDLGVNRVTFRDTKNGDDRVVPITPLLYERMLELPKVSKLVFDLSELSNYASTDLKRRAILVGLKKPLYNHVFRHSVATHLLRSRAPVKLVANILGWRDINTANRYDQTTIQDLEDVLTTYSRIWREHMSYQTLVEKIKEYVSNIVDTNVAMLKISQGQKTLKIEITEHE